MLGNVSANVSANASALRTVVAAMADSSGRAFRRNHKLLTNVAAIVVFAMAVIFFVGVFILAYVAFARQVNVYIIPSLFQTLMTSVMMMTWPARCPTPLIIINHSARALVI